MLLHPLSLKITVLFSSFLLSCLAWFPPLFSETHSSSFPLLSLSLFPSFPCYRSLIPQSFPTSPSFFLCHISFITHNLAQNGRQVRGWSNETECNEEVCVCLYSMCVANKLHWTVQKKTGSMPSDHSVNVNAYEVYICMCTHTRLCVCVWVHPCYSCTQSLHICECVIPKRYLLQVLI